ncbi:YhgE/Pip domain-containing protein [Bacillus sp. EAC]|uniref:YhgE/Pip domain-containing protein n=1 Tax=Bacillus sp. EAC TaxID=1978338 RepID=UPI00211B7189|nr:YhgE/Pip domain-containing protein [Bacillus sp. EAC]
MNTQFAKEFSNIVRNKKLLIPIIAVLLVPLLYSGMFLWAFWDPYEKLDQLPVAVVNLDEGTELEGKKITIGNEFIENLKNNDNFQWHFVDNKTASKGLENQDYYMIVRIPRNFSSNAATVLDDKPKKLTMEYIPNEGFNFLSGQIGGTAAEKIKEQIGNTISRTYVETIYDKIGELTDGISKASDGSSKLDKGVGSAKDGSTKLANGLKELSSKSIELKEGVGKLEDGSKQELKGLNQYTDGVKKVNNGLQQLESNARPLHSGINQLAEGSIEVSNGLNRLNGKMPLLHEGSEKLLAGSKSISQGLSQWQQGATSVSTGAKQVADGIEQLQKEIGPLLSSLPAEQQAIYKAKIEALVAGSKSVSNGVSQLSASADKLNEGGKSLADGAGKLNSSHEELASGVLKLVNGQSQVSNGLNQLNEKTPQLVDGIDQLANGTNELNSNSLKLVGGMSQIADGISTLNGNTPKLVSGVDQLKDGSVHLEDGLSRIKEGTNELSSKLGEAKTATKHIGTNDKQLDMYSDPVKLSKESVNSVPNYGTGFTPYFLSMGLYVGGLLLSVVFPLREAAKRPSSAFSWYSGKTGILIGVGIIQSIIASVALVMLLGLDVKSLSYYLLISMVASFAFLTLIQFLVTVFGDAGRFLAIIALILQLTTSAGTFPLELVPDFLQNFNAILPMTYTVNAFKAVISTGDFSFMWQNLSILAGFIMLFSVITFVYFRVNFKKQFGNELNGNQTINA